MSQGVRGDGILASAVGFICPTLEDVLVGDCWIRACRAKPTQVSRHRYSEETVLLGDVRSIVISRKSKPCGDGVRSLALGWRGTGWRCPKPDRAWIMEYRPVPGKLSSRAARRLSISSDETLA
eukprot:1885482-Rhodomonas_salina.2